MAIVISLIPVGVIIAKIWTGAFAFWYDPARDMLSAWDNLSKPTLIGPPSGIPGIFYGPYWIWLLSLAELISHDPRWVDFFVMTIPYIIIFPLLFYFLKDVFDRKVSLLLWLLFILGYSTYAYSLWNPYPAPVLFFLFVVLLLWSDFDSKTLKQHLTVLAVGFTLGVLVNFHLSFGIGAVFGFLLYIIIQTCFAIRKNKKKIISFFKNRLVQLILFTLGFLIAFAPFFLFEIRHSFSQTKVFLNTFSHFGAVVQTTGLTKLQIVQEFAGRLAILLRIPSILAVGIFLLGILYLGIQWRMKKITFSSKEKRLMGILISMAVGIFVLYLTARNPIWSYHFIAVEVIFLLGIGVLLQKSKVLQILAAFWIVVLLGIFSFSSFHAFEINPTSVSGNVAAEEKVVKEINTDAKNHEYTVFIYSPSIYSYEYPYLFRYLYNKEVPTRPELNPTDSKLVYLIFPPQVKRSIHDDFVHYRTPDNQYKTIQQWTMSSGSTIIKRERKL